MKKEPGTRLSAAALLLAAAALPLNPALAQETTPPATVVDTAPPPADPAPEAQTSVPAPAATPTPAPTMQPVVNTRASGNEAPEAAAPVARRTAARAPVARVAPRRVTSSSAAVAPAAARTLAAPVATQPVVAAPAPAPEPMPLAQTPPPAPEAAPPPVPAEPAQQQSGSILPWLLAGLAALGALAFLLSRRRRRAEEEVYYEQTFEEPAPIAPLEPVPVMAATVAAAAPVVLTAEETGRPELDIALQPVRAGVTGEQAVVEFALAVDNHGSAPARDVRISTWMFPAGTADSELERMLIKGPAAATLTHLDAGGGERVESAVALPTSGIASDSVLPVVVAEARYRLRDGSEGRTSAAFAVGVPLEGELAHFDVENPSGLHEGVEAWPLGEPERV